MPTDWNPILRDGVRVGDLTNCVFSYRLKKNIGFALIGRDCAIGADVETIVNGRRIAGRLCDLPFI